MILFQTVSKTYSKEIGTAAHTALAGLSFSVARGETLGLIAEKVDEKGARFIFQNRGQNNFSQTDAKNYSVPFVWSLGKGDSGGKRVGKRVNSTSIGKRGRI
jgi:hypothetical protein